jgi:Protein of unknown function (DUF2827)
MARVRRYKVGLTIVASSDTGHALWSNGLAQNTIFLAQLLQRLEIVESVSLVLCPTDSNHPFTVSFGIPIISLETAVARVDILIEIGAGAVDEQHFKGMQKRGAKLVSYVASNVMVMGLEAISRGLDHGDKVHQLGWDAAWITPQHWRTNHAYIKLTRSKTVHQVPHIWEPTMILRAAAETRRNILYRPPPQNTWVVACFDSNVHVVETFHLPMLVTENAYRRKPSQIERLLLFGAEHLKNSAHVSEMINAMSLGRERKIFVETPHRLTDVIGRHCNAVVAHQWENNLNYLYWETLYLGWPLVHNSTAFLEVGYYYPEFDPIAGGDVMTEGLASHVSSVSKQSDAIRETLWAFSIDNPKVQRQYTNLIEDLFG